MFCKAFKIKAFLFANPANLSAYISAAALNPNHDKPITLVASTTHDTVLGGTHKLIIEANAGNDLIVGSNQADTIYAGQGDDVIYGDNIFNLHFRISNKMLDNNKIKHYHN